MSKDPNQGEGDRVSARRYNKNVKEFIDEGRVEQSANEAERFVEEHPFESAKDEMKARTEHGPGLFDSLVGKGRAVVERIKRGLHRE